MFDTVQYINSNLADAKTLVNTQLKQLTGKALATTVVELLIQTIWISHMTL